MARTLEELKGIRLGDMTPEERRLVTDAAVKRIERELNDPRTKAAMQKVFDDFERKEGRT